MSRNLSLLLALFVAGCAAHQQATPQQLATDQIKAKELAKQYPPQAQFAQRDETFKPVLDQYSNCNRTAAKGVAFQQGDPVSLALAARGLCAKFEIELKDAIKQAYGDILLSSDLNQQVENARQIMLERNAAEIVAYRAAKASAPPRPKPPKTYDY
jgi:hypothetical protein